MKYKPGFHQHVDANGELVLKHVTGLFGDGPYSVCYLDSDVISFVGASARARQEFSFTVLKGTFTLGPCNSYSSVVMKEVYAHRSTDLDYENRVLISAIYTLDLMDLNTRPIKIHV